MRFPLESLANRDAAEIANSVMIADDGAGVKVTTDDGGPEFCRLM